MSGLSSVAHLLPPLARELHGLIGIVPTLRLVEEMGGQQFPVSKNQRRQGAIRFERLAEVQEEILWIAEAAHLPVVWATQVLESLARTGRPSRAEVTDAAMGERAECVMLNKGEHILEAVKALDSILARMEAHQVKKRSMLRQLHWWVP